MKNKFTDWSILFVVFLFSGAALAASLFVVYLKLNEQKAISHFLPTDTQMYIENQVSLDSFSGYLEVLAVPFEYTAVAQVASGSLYVLNEQQFIAAQATQSLSGYVARSLDEGRYMVSDFVYEQPLEVLHSDLRFQRIYQQMHKYSPLRAYVDLGLLIRELIHSEDETTHLFQEFVFTEFLDDLGVVGVRMNEKNGALEFQILNAYNASIEEMPEDSLLYEVALADFVPDKEKVWFFDGFGFAKKFDLALQRAKEKAVLVDNLVSIYLKDLFEQTGIDAAELISLLEGEYAVYYDEETEYKQLAFEITDPSKLDTVRQILINAFDAMHKTYPATETVTVPVTLKDGSTGRWEVAAIGSLVSQAEYVIGSLAIESIEYDKQSVLAFVQVDDIFVIGSNADILKQNISLMLKGETLARSEEYIEMKSYFPFSGSDFLYVSGISFMERDRLLVGKHVFGDNMFLKAVIK